LFAIDALFLRLAALYAVLGMSLGIWMGISGDHGQYPTHAHINLLGWVSFALYGLIYRNVPAAAQSKLAPWHFGAANLGAVLLLSGIYAILSGHPEFEPLAAAGGMITLLGGALFAVILFSRPIAAQNDRLSPGRPAAAAQTAE
jgi:peptidoglycan/LPS O-acetylase OafA/YrhL